MAGERPSKQCLASSGDSKQAPRLNQDAAGHNMLNMFHAGHAYIITYNITSCYACVFSRNRLLARTVHTRWGPYPTATRRPVHHCVHVLSTVHVSCGSFASNVAEIVLVKLQTVPLSRLRSVPTPGGVDMTPIGWLALISRACMEEIFIY